jgi:hypothetical protein
MRVILLLSNGAQYEKFVNTKDVPFGQTTLQQLLLLLLHAWVRV